MNRTNRPIAWRPRGLGSLALLILPILTLAAEGSPPDRVLPSPQPPGGVPVAQVPQWVSFGSDDNGYSGGLDFTLSLFSSLKNPDGTRPAITYFVIGNNLVKNPLDKPEAVRTQLKRALNLGNEVGSHTFSHTDGAENQFTAVQWQSELTQANAALTTLGQAPGAIKGFRTPFLSYNDATFTALTKEGFSYDTSIEEGSEKDQDGTNTFWPYTLDEGSPGDLVAATTWRQTEPIGKHPGLWELPATIIIAPPDELCGHYGVEPGLRARLAKAFPDDVDPTQGKLSSMDWYLWYLGLSPREFVASLEYTLDQRLKGNRAPLLFCIHSDIYDSHYDADNRDTDWIGNFKVPYLERRQALAEFAAYAVRQPGVRVAPFRDILAWLRKPEPNKKQP